jgi:hypothetical protein
MNFTAETIEWGGWKNNLRLANDFLELIVTLDVGPRILYMAPRRPASDSTPAGIATGDNLFCIFDEQNGGTNESDWQIRGGHRLWLAPESSEDDPFTYFPDNAPVAWENLGEGRIRLTPPNESVHGIQKEIELRFHAESARVDVIHRITNTGEAPKELAPWALSVMSAGGTAIIPQPALGSHPQDLLPNRVLVLWPYTDLKDPRLNLGSGFFTLQQDTSRGPIKIGLAHAGHWIAYAREDVLFVKHFSFEKGAAYPDNGCNCELFTNKRMIEVETLGPLQTLAPGETTEHIEGWHLYTGLAGFDVASESSIASAIKGVLPSLGGPHH